MSFADKTLSSLAETLAGKIAFQNSCGKIRLKGVPGAGQDALGSIQFWIFDPAFSGKGPLNSS